MKGRPYISCPLSAALAAKNFGFKFIVYPTPEQINEYDSVEPWDWLHTCHDNFCLEVCHIEDAISYIKEASTNKIYIAEESLPLLEPMVWQDVVAVETHRNNGKEKYGLLSNKTGMSVCVGGMIISRDHIVRLKIIQRNGKPFPRIEYEDTQATEEDSLAAFRMRILRRCSPMVTPQEYMKALDDRDYTHPESEAAGDI